MKSINSGLPTSSILAGTAEQTLWTQFGKATNITERSNIKTQTPRLSSIDHAETREWSIRSTITTDRSSEQLRQLPELNECLHLIYWIRVGHGVKATEDRRAQAVARAGQGAVGAP